MPNCVGFDAVPDVICMGEVMVELNAVSTGPLRNVTLFEKHTAGAEGNVAIGVSRLGLSAGIIGRVGDDEFGQFLLNSLRGENVDTTHLVIDRDFPTAVFFIQRGYSIPGKSKVYYYRRNSAGSKLNPFDVDTKYIACARVFHMTGITPALSETASDATTLAAKTTTTQSDGFA